MKMKATTLELPEIAKTFMKLPQIAPRRQTIAVTESPPAAALAGRKSQFMVVLFYSLVAVSAALAVKAAPDLNEILMTLKAISVI